MIRKGQAYGSAAGAKVGLVHRFILGLRGDELNSQSSTPIFGSTTKSQHIRHVHCDLKILYRLVSSFLHHQDHNFRSFHGLRSVVAVYWG